jgi:hypothetical protein
VARSGVVSVTVLAYYCSDETKENQQMSIRVAGQELNVVPPE